MFKNLRARTLIRRFVSEKLIMFLQLKCKVEHLNEINLSKEMRFNM